MKDWQSLSHVRWECKYHIVFIPKYRKKVMYRKYRRKIGDILRTLAKQRNVEILEGHILPDHIHICLSIPPKYSVSHTIGFLKGKSAVRIHRMMGSRKVSGMHFWARGYCVSTVGLDEETVRKYIREQEALDQQLDLDFD